MSGFSFIWKYLPSRRKLPREGEQGFKNLKDFTDFELQEILERNQETDLAELAGICSEILRRQYYNRG